MSNSTERSGIRLSGQGIQAQESTQCGRSGRMVCLSWFTMLIDSLSDIETASQIRQHPRSYVQEAAWGRPGVSSTDARIWWRVYWVPGSQPSSSRKFYGSVIRRRLSIDTDMCPIQCLNLLRMGVHQDYYMQEAHKPAIFRDRPWTIKLHFGT